VSTEEGTGGGKRTGPRPPDKTKNARAPKQFVWGCGRKKGFGKGGREKTKTNVDNRCQYESYPGKKSIKGKSVVKR